MITSAENPRIRQIGKLLSSAKARREAGCFVAEGWKLFLETPESARKGVFVSAAFEAEQKEQLKDCSYEVVDDRLFFKLADTKTPQGILTLAETPAYKREDLLPAEEAPCTVLVLEDIQDPGNLGTILRTAEAAGVSGVFMSRQTADPFQPKVVRATMGSIFRVPLRIEEDLPKTVSWLKERGVQVIATDLRAECSFREVTFAKRTAFLFGNEGNGLRPALGAMADRRVRIPMQGKVESLNVAIAAAILLFDK